jgi:hypothetical protein
MGPDRSDARRRLRCFVRWDWPRLALPARPGLDAIRLVPWRGRMGQGDPGPTADRLQLLRIALRIAPVRTTRDQSRGMRSPCRSTSARRRFCQAPGRSATLPPFQRRHLELSWARASQVTLPPFSFSSALFRFVERRRPLGSLPFGIWEMPTSAPSLRGRG